MFCDASLWPTRRGTAAVQGRSRPAKTTPDAPAAQRATTTTTSPNLSAESAPEAPAPQRATTTTTTTTPFNLSAESAIPLDGRATGVDLSALGNVMMRLAPAP